MPTRMVALGVFLAPLASPFLRRFASVFCMVSASGLDALIRESVPHRRRHVLDSSDAS